MTPYKTGIVCLFQNQESTKFLVLVLSYDSSFKTLKDNKDKTLKENKTRQLLQVNKTNNLKGEGKEGRERNHSLSAPCTLFSSMLVRAYKGKQANTFSDAGAHHLGPWR